MIATTSSTLISPYGNKLVDLVVPTEEVEELKRHNPLDQIQTQVNKSDRDFAAALRDPKPDFILDSDGQNLY